MLKIVQQIFCRLFMLALAKPYSKFNTDSEYIYLVKCECTLKFSRKKEKKEKETLVSASAHIP